MDKIPTADQFIDNIIKAKKRSHVYTASQVNYLIVEFAKLHVITALEVASEKSRLSLNGSNVPYGEHTSEKCGTWTINKESILNAYPLENIK